jgi:hypothetical protein
MEQQTKELLKEITKISDIEKLQIIDTLIEQLDKPDPTIDEIWKTEASNRWKAYKTGNVSVKSHKDVMKKYYK